MRKYSNTIARLTFFAVFAYLPLRSEARTPYIVTTNTLAATSKEEYNRALRMTMDGDSRALMNYIMAGAGVRILNRGTKVYLNGLGGLFSGLVKVRIPGSYQEYYVASEHVREFRRAPAFAPAPSYSRPQNAATPESPSSEANSPQETIEGLLEEAEATKRAVARYEKDGNRKYAKHYTQLVHKIWIKVARAYLEAGEREACAQQLDLIPEDSPVSEEVAKIRKVLPSDATGIDAPEDDTKTEPNKPDGHGQ